MTCPSGMIDAKLKERIDEVAVYGDPFAHYLEVKLEYDELQDAESYIEGVLNMKITTSYSAADGSHYILRFYRGSIDIRDEDLPF